MEKDYVVKSVSIKKDLSWNIYSYSINYYHKKNERFIYTASYSIEDFKKLYPWIDPNSLVGQSIWVKRELILK